MLQGFADTKASSNTTAFSTAVTKQKVHMVGKKQGWKEEDISQKYCLLPCHVDETMA